MADLQSPALGPISCPVCEEKFSQSRAAAYLAHAVTHSLVYSSESREAKNSSGEGQELAGVRKEGVVHRKRRNFEAESIPKVQKPQVVFATPCSRRTNGLGVLGKEVALRNEQNEVKDEPVTSRSGNNATEQVGECQSTNFIGAAIIPETKLQHIDGAILPSMNAEAGEPDRSMEADSVVDASLLNKVQLEHRGRRPFAATQAATLNQSISALDDSLQCGTRFSRRGSLKRHMLCHAHVKPHLCGLCGTSFIFHGSLQRHMLCHSGEKPYNCQYCGKCFARKCYLQQHMMTHSVERPHRCQLCGAGFAFNGSLQRHMLCHSGEKPYKCQHCDKCFARTDHLHQHMNTHSVERPHRCQLCGAGFAFNGSLQRHMLCHSGDKPLKCER